MQWPQGKFKCILADPPWSFQIWSAKGNKKSPSRHYSCMSLEDICALPVSQLTDDDGVLFLWTTDPFLQKAFEVIQAWDYTYKTMGFVWVKSNRTKLGFFHGTGYWTRANPEYLLLATKGSPKRIHKNIDTLLIAPRREHSRKPEEIYAKIEGLVAGPRLELFARSQRPGWTCWGDETDKFTKETNGTHVI